MTLSIAGVSFLMLSVLVIAGLGYLLGRITIKGISLGTAGTFIVALIFGCLFYTTLNDMLTIKVSDTEVVHYTSQALKVIENLGLILFVSSVGFIAGPGFFANMKKNFKSYVLLGMVISLLGALTTAGCILVGQNFSDLSLVELTAMVVGILSGSLTSTPAFSAAKESVADVATELVSVERLESLVTVGHGIAYLFGVIGVVLFIQLVPKLAKADMKHEIELLSGAEVDTGAKKKTFAGKLIEIDSFGFAPLVIACALGIVVGNVKIAGFSLTTTGGTLLVSLLFGHFARIGKISITPPEATLKVLREFGLVLFLIGAGVAGGAEFIKEFEVIYFVYGVIITIVPMIIGFLFSKYVLKLNLLNNLGSLTGGMTSTPALGTLIGVSGTEKVAAAYAATYPLALISIVIFSKLLITFLH